MARRTGEADPPRRAARAVHPPVRGGFLRSGTACRRVRRPPARGRARAGDARRRRRGRRTRSRCCPDRAGTRSSRCCRRCSSAADRLGSNDPGPAGSADRRPRPGSGTAACAARGSEPSSWSPSTGTAPWPSCGAAMVASGTATLECALLGVPMVVGYRLHALSYLLARHLVRVPHVALVNLVAGRSCGARAGAGRVHGRGAGRGGRGAARGRGRPAADRACRGATPARRGGRQRARGAGRAGRGAGGRMKAFAPTSQVHETAHRLGRRSRRRDDRSGGRLGLHGLPHRRRSSTMCSERGQPCPVSAMAPRSAVAKVKAPKVPEVGIVKEMRGWFEHAKAGLRRHLPNDTVAILLLGFLTVFVRNLFMYLGHYSFFRAGLATVKDLRDRLMDSLHCAVGGVLPAATVGHPHVARHQRRGADHSRDLRPPLRPRAGLLHSGRLSDPGLLAELPPRPRDPGAGASAAGADRALHPQAAPPLAPEPGAAG